MKKYTGNVSVTKESSADWEKKLKDVTEVSGDVIAYQGATLTLPALTEVSGYVRVDTILSAETEKVLWKAAHKRKWYLTDRCSEWLLSRDGDIEYKINNVEFDKSLFDKVRKDELSAKEVFAIANTEQRRVAYERMDKIKMKQLKGFKVLDEVKDDGHGYPMRLVSFSLDSFDTPFYYLNCFCPSSGREYFIETRQNTCKAAKGLSFGDSDIVFDAEW